MKKLWKLCTANLFALGVVFMTLPAQATLIDWTNWTSKTFGNPGSATGTMGGVNVTYTGELFGAADQGDWNFATYTDPGVVDNTPTPANISIQLTGGNNTVNTITFSQFVLNPVMAIQSLGNSGNLAEYVFTTPFTILNDGNGHWGGSAGDLWNVDTRLFGTEGNGIIQFVGAFTSISWTVPDGEYYHMFTVGAPASPVPEPATMLLFATGIAGIAGSRMRRKKVA